MHPPAHVCRELYRLHPHLRLAWVGRAPLSEGELNPGSFAIVQLYSQRDAGTPDEPNSYREFYDAALQLNDAGIAEMSRIDRGPIFNKDGGLRRDWDPLQRTPMFIANLSAYRLSNRDVYSSKFIFAVKLWLTDIVERVRSAGKQKAKDVKNKVKDQAAEMSSELWKTAMKHESSGVTMSKKHAKEDEGVKQLNAWKERGGVDYEKQFVPAPPKGYAS
jgi:hypothetical protein